MKKILIFVVCFLEVLVWSTLINHCYAQEKYFDFVSKNGVVGLDGSYDIELIFDIEKEYLENLLIRPRIDKGTVSIFNDIKKIWIPGNSNWSDMPKLSREAKLKVFGVADETTEIYFEVLDQKTLKVYETQHKEIVGRAVYDRYIAKLNENALRWSRRRGETANGAETAEQSKDVPVSSETTESSNTRKIPFASPTKHSWIFLAAFGCTAVIGATYGLMRRKC